MRAESNLAKVKPELLDDKQHYVSIVKTLMLPYLQEVVMQIKNYSKILL